MPQIDVAKPTHPKRPLVLALTLVGVVVVVVAIGVTTVSSFRKSVADAANQADVLDGQGLHSLAYSQLQGAYPHALNNADKITLLTRLAPDAETLGKDGDALTYYTDLNRLQPHKISTLMGLGEVAAKQGHKDVALSAYREALALEKAGPQGPRYKNNIAGLNSLISDLEKQ